MWEEIVVGSFFFFLKQKKFKRGKNEKLIKLNR